MNSQDLEFWQYQGTPEGDRLTTLAAGYRMSFQEKLEWSERCFARAAHAQHHRLKPLWESMAAWPDPSSQPRLHDSVDV